MSGRVESSLHRSSGFNACVATHELRMRMRGGRPFVVLFVYTLLAAIAVLVTLALTVWQRNVWYGGGLDQTGLGRTTLTALAFAQLSLILIVVPAYGAGAITMEREKRTLEMLRATLLSPGDIVTGKFMVVVAFGVILLVASLPVAAWCLLLGGVGMMEVFRVYAYLFAVAAWVAAIGLFLSTIFRRSIAAIVGTYAVLLVWCVGLPLLIGLIIETLMYYSAPQLAIGPVGAALILIAVGAIVGWLLFLALRWLGHRFWRRARRWLGTAAPALAVLCLVVMSAYWLGAGLLHGLSAAPCASVALLHPFVGLSAILYSDLAEEILKVTGGTGTPGPAGLQTYITVLTSGLFLLMAVALWARAISLFRRRP